MLVVLVVVVVVVVVMVVVMGDKHFYTKGRELLYVGIGDGDEDIAGGKEEDVSRARKLSAGARICMGL